MGRVGRVWRLRALLAAVPLLALLLPLFGVMTPASNDVAAAPPPATSGVTWSWGTDIYGQLGDGTISGEGACSGNCAPVPQQVTPPVGASAWG